MPGLKIFAFAISVHHFAKDITRYTICVYHNFHEILYHDISSIMIITSLVFTPYACYKAFSLYIHTCVYACMHAYIITTLHIHTYMAIYLCM